MQNMSDILHLIARGLGGFESLILTLFTNKLRYNPNNNYCDMPIVYLDYDYRGSPTSTVSTSMNSISTNFSTMYTYKICTSGIAM